jgi:O-antigen/teichoic acid export membrane protein
MAGVELQLRVASALISRALQGISDARRSDFVRQVAETFGTRIALIAIGVVTSVLVARILGPEGRGLYAVAGTVLAIGVQFGNLGLHASNTYCVAKDRSLLPALTANTLVVSFLIGGGSAMVVGLIFSIWPATAPVNGWMLIFALVAVPFGLAYLLLQNLLLGIQKIRDYNRIELYSRIGGVVCITALLMCGRVMPETVFGASVLVLIGAFTWACFAVMGETEARPQPSMKLFRENIRYGLKAYAAAFLAFALARSSILIVKYNLGDEPVGLFSVATAFSDLLCMLPATVGSLLFPKLSAITDRPARWRTARKVCLLVLLLMIVPACSVIIWAKPIIVLLYGRPFLAAVPSMQWLMPGVLACAVNVILMNGFAAEGMPSVTVYSPAIALAVNVPLTIMLTSRFGILGASVANSATLAIMLVISILYLIRNRNRS